MEETFSDINNLKKTLEELTIYVEKSGSDDGGDGSLSLPYLTVQKAIDSLPEAINHDCRIRVGAGTYNEKPVIRKLTTLGDSVVNSKYLFIIGDPVERLSEQTAEGGTRTTITDTGAFTGEDYSGDFIEILAGPNFVPSAFYWFTNFYPIRSNTNDVLTLGCKLNSALSNATHYRIIRNATIIEGDGTSTHFGLTNYSMQGVEVHVQSIEFTKSYFGINNLGRLWVQGCSFEFDTIGYTAIMSNVGSYTLADGCYVHGAWTNADVSLNFGLNFTCRQSYLFDGKSGIENDSGNYFFSYGCVIDTMTDYGIKAVNSGIVKGSDSVNTGSEYSNCAKQAFYAVLGGQINEHNASGAGSAEIGRTIGASNILYNSSRITAVGEFTFDDGAGTITDRNNGAVYTGVNYLGADQSLLAADAVAVSFIDTVRVVGNGAARTLTSTPSIEAGLKDGQELTIQGTSNANTITLQDESNLGGSTLALSGGNDMTLGLGDMIKLKWDSGDSKWYEISRSDN